MFKKAPVSWSKLLDEETGTKNTKSSPSASLDLSVPTTQSVAGRSLDLSSLVAMGLNQQPKQFESDFMKQVYSPDTQDKTESSATVKKTTIPKKSGPSEKIFALTATSKVPGQYLNKALSPKKPTGSGSVPSWSAKGKMSAAKTSGAVISLGDFVKKSKDEEKPVLKSIVVANANRPKTAPSGGKPEEKSGVVKSVGPTGLSQTLASWKKSRGVKSAGELET